MFKIYNVQSSYLEARFIAEGREGRTVIIPFSKIAMMDAGQEEVQVELVTGETYKFQIDRGLHVHVDEAFAAYSRRHCC